MKERKCEWFMEPLNAFTNDAIRQRISGENIYKLADKSGKTHDVWGCSWSLIEFFNKSKNTQSNLDFRIYNRRSRNEPLRDCTFMLKAKKNSEKKKILKQVKELQNSRKK